MWIKEDTYFYYILHCCVDRKTQRHLEHTVSPGSNDPSEKILNIFASENEVYTIY